jgi:hypothetical protein
MPVADGIAILTSASPAGVAAIAIVVQRTSSVLASYRVEIGGSWLSKSFIHLPRKPPPPNRYSLSYDVHGRRVIYVRHLETLLQLDAQWDGDAGRS